MTDTEKMTIEEAQRVLRDSYWRDVGDTANSIRDELAERIEDGDKSGDLLREWLIEHIQETVDGSSRVIHTARAQECLLYSNNSDQYFYDFGREGVFDDGGINWSALAYSAFERDVIEQLAALGVDVNDPAAGTSSDSSSTDES